MRLIERHERFTLSLSLFPSLSFLSLSFPPFFSHYLLLSLFVRRQFFYFKIFDRSRPVRRRKIREGNNTPIS